ncbi:NADPH2:quinone reductase [Tardiphaga sp. OK245]|nr:quinone oxidoreductase [Tardiphaga sp. OK245]SEH88334.1 NADPH2:quinone reductase [Tardiphaga sp. OK245]
MPKVVTIRTHGGPDVLGLEEAAVGLPGEGELRIKQSFCGVNFIDTYFRSGLYPVALPFVPGQEGVGVITEIGARVNGFKIGDRVTYATMSGGGYASERIIPADAAIRVPDFVNDHVGAAVTMKGLTAQMLIRQVYKAGPGTTMLVHAAAGGVGSILAQWGTHLGATVIGTVGSPDKAEFAREYGCHHVIDYAKENFAERVKQITGGRMCDVVYDGVGKVTAIGSLDSLKPLGTFISYGNASGPVENFGLLELAKRGSLFATRPMMPHYASTSERRSIMADEFFAALQEGAIKPPPIKEYALADAALAHRELESRKSMGCLVLAT